MRSRLGSQRELGNPSTWAGGCVTRRLGTEPVTFPGGHDGFVGAEYGGMGEPDAFAATLRKILAG